MEKRNYSKKIVFAGGPGTGKSTMIEKLDQSGHKVLHEVSREIVQHARKNGIEHLFLNDPLAFSNKLLEKRIKQYQTADNTNSQHVFIDRGIPEITAYLDYNKTPYPAKFVKANKHHPYDLVFLFPVWEAIFKQDDVRYETLEQSKHIQENLIKTYETLGYKLVKVPKASTSVRKEFILNTLSHAG
ncbi:MAG: ATP-binding protein [Psychroflexus sp.]|jgi:predicted ATPase|nr:ATP-binding protein [Psychroflexus sp.]MDR9448222.1 ATP-binding protein [Psychroflexus sp.]